MDYGKFEFLIMTLYDLCKLSGYLAQLLEDADVEVHKDAYVNIVRLHNVAVDTIEAIEKYYTKEEN